MVIEVLSPSTAAFDRGEKGWRYRTWLPSLEEYVLVAQDRPHVEHWKKQPDGQWLVGDVQGLAASLALESLAVRVPLAEVYERVVFPSLPSRQSRRRASRWNHRNTTSLCVAWPQVIPYAPCSTAWPPRAPAPLVLQAWASARAPSAVLQLLSLNVSKGNAPLKNLTALTSSPFAWV